MKAKGFLLIETIMGLFLLGLVAVICLPMINTAIDNMRMSKCKLEMLFISESIIEQIKAFDYAWTDKEYIFDMDLKELMDALSSNDAVSINLPLKDDNTEHDYHCVIYKRNYCDGLWEVQVKVSTPYKKDWISNIDIFTLIAAPQMDGDRDV